MIPSRNQAMWRYLVIVTVCVWSIPTALMVNSIVPRPYMDEIFHIPQAQQYCQWNFRSWDPMITTPPGLYLASLLYVACWAPNFTLQRRVSSLADVCSTPILRSVNCLLAVVCSVVVYEIICHVRPGIRGRTAALASMALSLFPLHWFFTFLYYTDVASLTAVLAMYLTSLRKRYRISALIGLSSVLIRQTNIVWMLFVACTGMLETIGNQKRKTISEYERKLLTEESIQSASKKMVPERSSIRRRKIMSVQDYTEDSSIPTTDHFSEEFSSMLEELQAASSRSWAMKCELFSAFYPFIIVFLLFIAFVWWNGNLVLGAKEAHTASPHIAQLLYFSIFSALMMAPVHFSLAHASELLLSLAKSRHRSIYCLPVAVFACFVAVHYFSFAHPYLLADNRHYTFYLWRKITMSDWPIKYLLVPIYAYSWHSIVATLRKRQSRLWVLGYCLCTAAVLIPAPLVEFRYYTVPFFFLAVHSPVSRIGKWVAIGGLFAAVDAFTMFMFLFRTFRWSHEEGVQRFLW